MNRRLKWVQAVVIFVCVAACNAVAQDVVSRPTDSLIHTRPADKLKCTGVVVVQFTDGRELKGSLYRVRPDTLGVWDSHLGLTCVARKNIRAIFLCKDFSLEGCLLGLSLGLAGNIFARAVTHEPRPRGLNGTEFFLTTVGSSLIGMLIGSSVHKCEDSRPTFDFCLDPPPRSQLYRISVCLARF